MWDRADLVEVARETGAELRVVRFIQESNEIEGILRLPMSWEITAHRRLWALARIEVADLEEFVRVVAARPLRRHVGQDVRVGRHVAPPGGPEIEVRLARLLSWLDVRWVTPFVLHRRYELLHPFVDGNGRSGRALWAWHMTQRGEDPFALPFLQWWYYRSLEHVPGARSKSRER